MPSRAAVYSPSTFDDHNDSARPTVAVASQGFADRHWRDRSPLGQYVRFMVRGASVRAESVGVVDDLRYEKGLVAGARNRASLSLLFPSPWTAVGGQFWDIQTSV